MAWVIAGLGNPGKEYELSPHNAGRAAVISFARQNDFSEFKASKPAQALVSRGVIGKAVAVLVLPETYMNKSGAAVKTFVKSVKQAEKLIVIHDDLDLPLGRIKVSQNRGSGGHKGLESIDRAIKTQNYVRIRIGISPSSAKGEIKKPKGEEVVEKFLLNSLSPSDIQELKLVSKRINGAIEAIIERGVAMAMNEYNG